jgi:hypothetical protein
MGTDVRDELEVGRRIRVDEAGPFMPSVSTSEGC